jgi:ribosomal protein L11 methyltransferase
MTDSWRVTLPCSRQEAERLKDDIGPLAELDPPPVLMTSEPDPARPDFWQLDAYFEGRPSRATIAQLAALVAAPGPLPAPVRLPDEDWVTLSQAGLEPINEGRFHVHTLAGAGQAPPGAISFRIEAGRAFGTGQHETTAGCLAMLDRLKRQRHRYRRVIDVGTGTGVLAFAAAALWPARVVATDIDPVSIEVTAENAAINGLETGRARDRIELIVADGLGHPRLSLLAPYDLVIANILAGPLIDLAPSLANALAPGGTLVLAGLLDKQASAVTSA